MSTSSFSTRTYSPTSSIWSSICSSICSAASAVSEFATSRTGLTVIGGAALAWWLTRTSAVSAPATDPATSANQSTALVNYNGSDTGNHRSGSTAHPSGWPGTVDSRLTFDPTASSANASHVETTSSASRQKLDPQVVYVTAKTFEPSGECFVLTTFDHLDRSHESFKNYDITFMAMDGAKLLKTACEGQPTTEARNEYVKGLGGISHWAREGIRSYLTGQGIDESTVVVEYVEQKEYNRHTVDITVRSAKQWGGLANMSLG